MARKKRPSWYQPLEAILVRAPLLPIESYLNLHDPTARAASDPQIRCALAVGSSEILAALGRSTTRDPERLRGKLLRFLIRMSTRPTPFGLFAGVALGEWGDCTDLALAETPPRPRTRPDMDWLLRLVQKLEADPQIRSMLRLQASGASFERAGRIFVSERVGASGGVSVRATGVTRRALALARTPIGYGDLCKQLLSSTPNATPAKVDRLVTELWQQTLLRTDLIPPLTCAEPARWVVDRLEGIAPARAIRDALSALIELAAAWDQRPPTDAAGFALLRRHAEAILSGGATPPLEVDLRLSLSGQRVTRAVADEVVRAAELLLRWTPLPFGPPQAARWRQAFIARYGLGREVPLFELLDPEIGLGPNPPTSGGTPTSARSARRAQTLMNLALSALRLRRLVVDLDDETAARLDTWNVTPGMLPPSIDLNVFVAARSAESLDAGEFQIVIGPNLGASAAGRMMGRFADMLGPDGRAAVERAARAEERTAPQRIWAELVYLPHRFRSANVAVRPAVRSHEIVFGVSPGVEHTRTIPLDELVVGVSNGRLRLRWTRADAEVIACTGHMLNYAQAPAACRFLHEISHDGCALLSAFDWGPASAFPFLPRVQTGRVVLHEAQWRLDARLRERALPVDAAESFATALGRWRSDWDVPRHVYLRAADHRLLLDLEEPLHREELRDELRRMHEGGALTLQEAVPNLEHAWLRGPGGHYVTELVVSLVRRDTPKPLAPTPSQVLVPSEIRRRPPGSDWLFLKLYGSRAFEEELLTGPVRAFIEQVHGEQLTYEWFFVRYSDPDPHLRLRFRGAPEHVRSRLMPLVCAWAARLMDEGTCLRFAFDTYDREVERYGGPAAMSIAESIFASDTRAVVSLLALLQGGLAIDVVSLAVLSMDDLLAALGLSARARLDWLKRTAIGRKEVGPEYRQRRTVLTDLLRDSRRVLPSDAAEELTRVLGERRDGVAPLSAQLCELARTGRLALPLAEIYDSIVHMHCNRLLHVERGSERRVRGLLLRARESIERCFSEERG